MRLFGSRKSQPETVPGNATAAYFDLLGMDEFVDRNTPCIGLDGPPEWITPEEAARREAALAPPPPVEELMADPLVRSIVEVCTTAELPVEAY